MNTLTPRMLWQAVVGGLLVACAGVAQEPAKPAAGEVTDKEKLALGRVHRNAVEIFVDRPGFGVRRLALDLKDLLARPNSLADQDPPTRGDAERPAPKAANKPSHYAVRDLLLQRGGRIPTDDGKETWRVREVYLVGLVANAEPVVYLVDGNPKKNDEKPKDRKDIPTRGLDAFEKAAVAAVRGGEPLKAEKNGKDIRLLAPIFAGKRCTACHDQGALLGGFTYELERVAYDPEKDGVRPKGR
jgi:hypothetical protein